MLDLHFSVLNERFITGPTELGHAATIGKIPRVFIIKDGKWEAFAVIVYKVLIHLHLEFHLNSISSFVFIMP